MSTIVVAGFTQADIVAASVAAGAGGRVIFPNGTYTVDGVQNNYADQLWELETYAVIKRAVSSAALPIIDNLAQGFRLRGGKIQDDPEASNTVAGIRSDGYFADIRYTEIVDSKGHGILVKGADAIVEDNKITNAAIGGVWVVSNDAISRKDTRICKNRIRGAQTLNGVALRNNGEGWYLRPQVNDNDVEIKVDSVNAVVGMEILKCNGLTLTRNSVFNGRIGISLGGCWLHGVYENYVNGAADYLYEIGWCYHGELIGNRGWGGSGLGYGIEASGGSTNNLITGNNLPHCSTPYHQSADCSNHVHDNY